MDFGGNPDMLKPKEKTKTVEIEGGNLYDINKNLIAKNEKAFKRKELTKRIRNILFPYLNSHNTEKYFMLLCNEKKDYTVFHQTYLDHGINTEAFAEALEECLVNRGQIFGFDPTSDKVAIEIWIKDEASKENPTGLSCYYLFPYSSAVIELPKEEL